MLDLGLSQMRNCKCFRSQRASDKEIGHFLDLGMPSAQILDIFKILACLRRNIRYFVQWIVACHRREIGHFLDLDSFLTRDYNSFRA